MSIRRTFTGPAFLATVIATMVVGVPGSRSSGPSDRQTSASWVEARAPTGSPAEASAASAALRGNSEGLALLRRVSKAYLHVPSVLVTVPIEGAPARFTLVLAGGVIVAEEFSGGVGTTATKLVEPVHSPTYALEPGTSCWRRLSPTDPQALSDVGLRFPELQGVTRVDRPVRAQGQWLLALVGKQVSAIYYIDEKTLHVTSIKAAYHGRTGLEHVRALASAPQLYSPYPACAS